MKLIAAVGMLGFALSAFGFQAPAKPLALPDQRPLEAKTPERPFRIGFLSLNPDLDRQKPLAAKVPGGWTIQDGVLIGQFDNRWVGAQSLATGEVLWWFDGKTEMTAPPASFGRSVILGFRDGRIVKLNAKTGKRQWKVELDAFTEHEFLRSEGTLFVLNASQVMHALDFGTGESLWVYDAEFPEGLVIRATTKPVIHDGRVLFGVSSGEVLAVAVDSGQLAWRYNPAYNDAQFHDFVGELVVTGDRLLVSRYDGLVASISLGGSERKTTWSHQLPEVATSAFRNGQYYVGGLNGDLYAFDGSSGRRVFRTSTGVPLSTITAGETTLYVTGGNGSVFAMDANKGKILWYDDLGSSLTTEPLLSEDKIYFPTGLKSLYGYRIR